MTPRKQKDIQSKKEFQQVKKIIKESYSEVRKVLKREKTDYSTQKQGRLTCHKYYI